jgi:hypothetical protein
MTLKNQPHQSKKLVQLAYPLVYVYVTMERSPIFNGKTHYKWQFSIAMLNYQRVPPIKGKFINTHGIQMGQLVELQNDEPSGRFHE